MKYLCPICNQNTIHFSTIDAFECSKDIQTHFYFIMPDLKQWWWAYYLENKIVRMSNSNKADECIVKIQIGDDTFNTVEFPSKPMDPEGSLALALKKINLIPFT